MGAHFKTKVYTYNAQIYTNTIELTKQVKVGVSNSIQHRDSSAYMCVHNNIAKLHLRCQKMSISESD